jgi:hypothetical protein
MKSHQTIAAIGLAFVLSGCGGNDDATASRYEQALGHQLEELRGEQASHFAEVSAMQRVGLVGSVESGHAQRFDDHLVVMSRLLGGMMSCADGVGSPLDVTSLAANVHDLRVECDQHGILMMSAQQMDTVGLEEGRHQDVVAKLLEKMQRQLNTMAQPVSAHSTCSPCPSCGM